MRKQEKFVPSLNDRGYRFRCHAKGAPGASVVFDVRTHPQCFGTGDIPARSTCLIDGKGREVFEHDVLELRSTVTDMHKRNATGEYGPMLFLVAWRHGDPVLIDQDAVEWLMAGRVARHGRAWIETMEGD
jgi:hypothetical protein